MKFAFALYHNIPGRRTIPMEIARSVKTLKNHPQVKALTFQRKGIIHFAKGDNSTYTIEPTFLDKQHDESIEFDIDKTYISCGDYYALYFIATSGDCYLYSGLYSSPEAAGSAIREKLDGEWEVWHPKTNNGYYYAGKFATWILEPIQLRDEKKPVGIIELIWQEIIDLDSNNYIKVPLSDEFMMPDEYKVEIFAVNHEKAYILTDLGQTAFHCGTKAFKKGLTSWLTTHQRQEFEKFTVQGEAIAVALPLGLSEEIKQIWHGQFAQALIDIATLSKVKNNG